MKIIFVCSENIMRSLTAEYCMKKYLKDNDVTDIEVMSAGTDSTHTDVSGHCFSYLEELIKLGIDISQHRRKPLTKEMVENADIIVSMAQDHQDWIKEHFNVYSPLYMELLENRNYSFILPNSDKPECDQVLRNFVHFIYSSMPRFVEKLRQYQLKKIAPRVGIK